MSLRRIVDASPLILLAKVGRLDLLRIGGVAVVVPGVVWDEVHAKGAADGVARAVDEAEWLVVAAKRLGLIPAARPVLESLQRAGLYLAEGFAEEALRRVDE